MDQMMANWSARMAQRRMDDIRPLPDLHGVSWWRVVWGIGLMAGATLIWGRNLSESEYFVVSLSAWLTGLLTTWWLTVRVLRIVGHLARWILRAGLREIRQAWTNAA